MLWSKVSLGFSKQGKGWKGLIHLLATITKQVASSDPSLLLSSHQIFHTWDLYPKPTGLFTARMIHL